MPLGPVTEATLHDPLFQELMWKMTPASMAVRLTNGQYKSWHYIQLLSRKLVDVAVGRCKRLIVCMPPRAGKSEMVSKWFPTWYLENFPERKFILAAYEADFAAKFGGKVRDIILENQDTLSVRLKGKTPAMHYFETALGGTMSTAGVGGPLTGKGANVLVIDDAVKNPCSVKSPVMVADGSTKLLGEVRLGERVITHKGRGRKITQIFERGLCECVHVKTFSGRELVAELTHPCLTLMGSWKKAGELEIGDRLCLPKSFELDPSTTRNIDSAYNILAGKSSGDKFSPIGEDYVYD